MPKKRKRKQEDEIMEVQMTGSAEGDQVSNEVVISRPTPRSIPKRKPTRRVRTPRNDLSITRKDQINLKAWFVNLLSMDRRVKEHHFEQVRLYMHGLGLGDHEEVSKYENALKGYFGG